jgi:hypothetical protein
MKKVFYLMLTLIVLGAASVNAQVRIGGSTDPNTAAILDLNATDDATPAANKGGLSFPRISLDTTNVKLNGVTPKEGTLVYNTNASMKGGQGKGIYMWNGTKWNSLVATVPVTSVTLSPSGTVNIPEGATTQITATTAPVNATNPIVNWTSSTPSVATVNATTGLITAVTTGTSTIIAKTNDGSGKSATVALTVFQSGADTATIGTNLYSVYNFPNGLGTWMMQDSREGTRDTIINGVYYYKFAHAASACVSPWVVPDSAQAAKVVSFMNHSPIVLSVWLGDNPVGSGYYYAYRPYYTLRRLDRNYWWTRSRHGNLSITYNNAIISQDNRVSVGTANFDLSWLPVRCVKP